MKNAQIHEIEFDNHELAMENKNYPHSGLFDVKIKTGMSDVRFVDKNIRTNCCVAPSVVFFEVTHKDVYLDPVEPKKYDGDFILEFSRILLNRKP